LSQGHEGPCRPQKIQNHQSSAYWRFPMVSYNPGTRKNHLYSSIFIGLSWIFHGFSSINSV
jgi:hypothetical protein